MRALFAMAESLDAFVEVVDELEAGQEKIHPLRFFQRECHVFDEVVREEAGVEISLQDARRKIVERPTRGGTAADGLEHRFEIKAGAFAVE